MTTAARTIYSNPNILGETLVFVGTCVRREQAIAALELVK